MGHEVGSLNELIGNKCRYNFADEEFQDDYDQYNCVNEIECKIVGYQYNIEDGTRSFDIWVRLEPINVDAVIKAVEAYNKKYKNEKDFYATDLESLWYIIDEGVSPRDVIF